MIVRFIHIFNVSAAPSGFIGVSTFAQAQCYFLCSTGRGRRGAVLGYKYKYPSEPVKSNCGASCYVHPLSAQFNFVNARSPGKHISLFIILSTTAIAIALYRLDKGFFVFPNSMEPKNLSQVR